MADISKRSLLLLVAYGLSGQIVHAAESCKVLDQELQTFYSGGCRDGLAEGPGFARGLAEYVGDFKAGKKYGRGVKRWLATGDSYIGDFVDDYRHGFGIYSWGERSPFANQRYSGQYEFDKRHGQGVYEWPNGDRYEGAWSKDSVSGYATPMQTLNYYHRQAVIKAVSQPGVKVCREHQEGLAGKRSQSGVVRAVSPEGKIQIELAVVSGATDSVGTVWAEPVDWLPCY